MKVSSETRLDDLVEHHPAARIVLSRYRLGSYEESEPPRESVAWFAEDRGIPAGRLFEKLGRVAAISRQEPPAFELPLAARDSPVAGRTFPAAPGGVARRRPPLGAGYPQDGRGGSEGAHQDRGRAAPARVRARRAYPGRGDTRFYINEHSKMLAILDGFMQTLPRLIEEKPAVARREIIRLFDQAYWFKRLLEHHDKREENILYPVLDQVTGEAERKELLEKCSLK